MQIAIHGRMDGNARIAVAASLWDRYCVQLEVKGTT